MPAVARRASAFQTLPTRKNGEAQQDKPFDIAQDKPFDIAQDKPAPALRQSSGQGESGV